MTPISKFLLTRLALVACLATALVACGGGGQGDSSSGASPSPDESASGHTAGAVDTGTTVTTWALPSTATKPPVTPGAWKEGGPEDASFKLLKELPHFAFYSDEAVPDADLATAAQTLESAWHNMFDASLLMPEPYANTADKIKPAIHIHSDWGANGGGWEDETQRVRLGMWIGTLMCCRIPGSSRTSSHTAGRRGYPGTAAWTAMNRTPAAGPGRATRTSSRIRPPEYDKRPLLGDAGECAAPLSRLHPRPVLQLAIHGVPEGQAGHRGGQRHLVHGPASKRSFHHHADVTWLDDQRRSTTSSATGRCTT